VFRESLNDDKAVELRKAAYSDAEVVFTWANDPSVREQAINPDQISWDSHLHWLAQKLASSDSHLFILEVSGEPAGLIRFDKENTSTFTLSYLLDRGFRGLGLAHRILSLGVAYLRFIEPGARVKALVKEGNTSSARAIAHAGFDRLNDQNIKGVRYLTFMLQ